MAAQTTVELPQWAQCLWQPGRYKALHGGRGGGKSRSIASALVLKAAEKPERILCAREVQKSIKDSVKRLLDDEIERMGLRSFFVSTETEIRGQNGSLFIFAGLRGNATQIKSLEGVTIAWVEEAQTISQGSLDTLVPTIRAPNSELWFSWNPDLETDPIDKMFRGETTPPGSIVREVNYPDNPWFPDVLRVEMDYDRSRDTEKHAHVWLGEYRQNSEARVFKNWTVEPFETPANAMFRFGADFGYSVDPTTLIRMFIGRWQNGVAIADPEGRNLFLDYEAWEIGCEIDKTPALFDTVPESRAWVMTADSSRPETISYLRRNGFPKIASAVKGARSVEEGVSFLQSYDIVIHPRCERAIAEFTMYSYKVDPLTGEVMPVLEDKDNHVIDAARYACEAMRRAVRAKPTFNVSVPSMASAFSRR